MIWTHQRKTLKLCSLGGEREMEEKHYVKKIKILISLPVYNSSLSGINNTGEHIHTIDPCVQMWLMQKELDAFQRRGTVQVPWTSQAGRTKLVAGSYRSAEEWLWLLATYCLRPFAVRNCRVRNILGISFTLKAEKELPLELTFFAVSSTSACKAVDRGLRIRDIFKQGVYLTEVIRKYTLFMLLSKLLHLRFGNVANIICNDHPQFLI